MTRAFRQSTTGFAPANGLMFDKLKTTFNGPVDVEGASARAPRPKRRPKGYV
jgi:hypothetical protein